MAPDKIYVGLKDVGSGYIWDISILDNGMEQYIRKDALLEWANNWLSFERSEIGLDKGFAHAMKIIIDKLNSM